MDGDLHIFIYIVQAAGIIFLVDFVGGVVHWAEDKFGTEDTPIFGEWLVKPDIIHHTPKGANEFLKNHWAYSSWDLFTAAPICIFFAWYFDLLTWKIWLFVIVGACSQQVHRFAHVSPSRLHFIPRLLQLMHIIQGHDHHWMHHKGEKNTHYCVITPFLNPILDHLKFWGFLERLVVPLFGAPRIVGQIGGCTNRTSSIAEGAPEKDHRIFYQSLR